MQTMSTSAVNAPSVAIKPLISSLSRTHTTFEQEKEDAVNLKLDHVQGLKGHEQSKS
jgi:hypothetical protein